MFKHRYVMRRSFPAAGGMLLLLALTANAATEVINRVPGPVSEFGAAAIRSASGGLSLGRVAISVSGDLKPEAFRIRAANGGYAIDRKSTRLNSSHLGISYAVFCLKKKNTKPQDKRIGHRIRAGHKLPRGVLLG